MDGRPRWITASTLRISNLLSFRVLRLLTTPVVRYFVHNFSLHTTIRLCRMELCQLIVLKQENVINDRMEDTLTVIHSDSHTNPHSDTHTPNTKTPYTQQVTHKQTHSHSQTHTATHTNRQIHRPTNWHTETHTLIHSHTWTTRNRHTEIHTQKLTDTLKQTHPHKHTHNHRQSDLNNRNFSNPFPPVDVIFERPLSKTWKIILYTVQIVCLPRAHTFIYTQWPFTNAQGGWQGEVVCRKTNKSEQFSGDAEMIWGEGAVLLSSPSEPLSLPPQRENDTLSHRHTLTQHTVTPTLIHT